MTHDDNSTTPGEPSYRGIPDSGVRFLAEGAGFGRSPWAPGTVGSLWGLAIGLWFQAADVSVVQRLVCWVAGVAVGVPLCQRAAKILGRKDPGSVVWDEIAAFPLVYAFSRVNGTVLLAGFLLFRLFDIWKPWPVRQFERLPGGLGIMADDQAAAVYACAGTSLISAILS